jgi:hypothetical protein
MNAADSVCIRQLWSLRCEVQQRSVTERSAVFDGDEVSRPTKLYDSQLQWLNGCLLERICLY